MDNLEKGDKKSDENLAVEGNKNDVKDEMIAGTLRGENAESNDEKNSCVQIDDAVGYDKNFKFGLILNQHMPSKLVASLGNIFFDKDQIFEKKRMLRKLKDKIGNYAEIMIFRDKDKIILVPLNSIGDSLQILTPFSLKTIIKSGKVEEQFFLPEVTISTRDFEKKYKGFETQIFLYHIQEKDYFATLPDFQLSSAPILKECKTEQFFDHFNLKMEEKNNKSNIKLIFPTWDPKSGDPHDWLSTCLYLISLNKNEYNDSDYIQMLLSAIRCDQIRLKLINELKRENDKDGAVITVDIFKTVFDKNMVKDKISYRESLKKLQYVSTVNFREFYSTIYHLVSKSSELDPTRDKTAIDKLSQQAFLEKLPCKIKQSLITYDAVDGQALADLCERIRAYYRLYLSDEVELNAVNSTNNSNIVCFNCSEKGHVKRNCKKPVQNHASRQTFQGAPQQNYLPQQQFQGRNNFSNNSQFQSQNRYQNSSQFQARPQFQQQPQYHGQPHGQPHGQQYGRLPFQGQNYAMQGQNNYQVNLGQNRYRFQGTCFNCNKKGHKSNRCWNNNNSGQMGQNFFSGQQPNYRPHFGSNNINTENALNEGGRDPNIFKPE